MFSDTSYNLRIELDTKNYTCSEEEIRKMEVALDTLDKVTKKFPVSDLYITVIHHPRSHGFHVKTALRLPGRTLFTGERHEHMYTAYERCTDKLVRKVTAYESMMQHEDEIARHQAGTDQQMTPTQVPDASQIRTAVQANDYVAFRRATSMYEEPLRKRVGRWVQRYPALNDVIDDRLQLADIVEDVFLTAFDQFEDRSQDVPPHEWLESLIDPCIRDIVAHPDRELENISMARSAMETEQPESRPGAE